MNQSKKVKIVVFVPESHADVLREAIGKAGAGRVGNYDYCSFSLKGFGRFRPKEGAHPAIGKIGKFEIVPEERVEIVCDRDILSSVIDAINKVHPYEETALDVYPLEEI